MTVDEFAALRYGMFVHFGLFSKIGRGEWTMNRERIKPEKMQKIAKKFSPDDFDADKICKLAVDGGMKYIIFTTMHHDGFRMYNSNLSDFNSVNYCKRDFTLEMMRAAKKHGLKFGLYHSLNNWYDQPDAAAALENTAAYQQFIANTFERLNEVLTLYNEVDIFWYDGWWPFNAEQWQAVKMNEMLSAIHPGILFNGRNCLPGDFGTPEQHLTAPCPYRPWEACVTLNNHWGFHPGDTEWKTPQEVIRMLIRCACNQGNLLLNVGPDGRGNIPKKSIRIIRKIGKYIANGGAEAIGGKEFFNMTPGIRQIDDRNDWDHHGDFSVNGNDLYFSMYYIPGRQWRFCGLEANIKSVTWRGVQLDFRQKKDVVTIKLPKALRKSFVPVLKLHCDRPPAVYRTGGWRVPDAEHPRYDPITPDIEY